MTSPTFADWFAAACADRAAIDTSMDAATARHAAFGDDMDAIPPGGYCDFSHTRQPLEPTPEGLPRSSVVPCPFWARNPDAPDQAFGYCAKLASGDWMVEGTMLLWDGVKECGLNDPDPADGDATDDLGNDEA